MKTNVSIELTDEQRDLLANYFDGKETKRLATRKEITQHVLAELECFLGDLEMGNQTSWQQELADEGDVMGAESPVLNTPVEQAEQYAWDAVLGSRTGPDGAKCPQCGTVNRFSANELNNRNIVCRVCRNQFLAAKRGDA